jgi:hypothetical protein
MNYSHSAYIDSPFGRCAMPRLGGPMLAVEKVGIRQETAEEVR